MKTIRQAIFAAALITLASVSETPAVPGTKIAVVCPDVVLWWPSTPGQSFLVEFRPDLNPGTAWSPLTNYLPAATATNQTTSIHSNQVQCASGGSFIGGGDGGGDPPVPNSAAMSTTAPKPTEPLVMPANGSGSAVPLAIYPPGFDLSAFIIFDPSTDEWVSGSGYTIKPLSLKAPLDTRRPLDGPQPDDPQGDSASGNNMGFYRVINVTPTARNDIFGVEQYSSANQLDILKNDSDPNDDRFLISALGPAGHGDIQYTPDASTFQYTPAQDFWGIDSFTYTITNLHGSSATATATVFVNQSGNQQPSAADVLITLDTNVYTAAFNALTNALDPDADTLILFAVSTPLLGNISTNAAGDVTYTRNPAFFGRDTFTYLVTDGKGGYAVGNAVISQVDSDGDGMPDEWEMRNGLDPMSDDSAADLDNDGLPNLAEYLLHTSPHSPDNPLNLAVTNGAPVSGFAQIPIQGLSPDIGNQPIALYVNGTPAANSAMIQGPDGQWLLNWNTVFLPNGTYSVKAGFQYNPNVGFGATSVVFGPEKTVQVTNAIRFAQLTSTFTDYLVIDASLSVQNATVHVQLYDDYDNPLVYGTYSTSNGHIQPYWDLTDGNGNQISFGNVHGKFSFAASGETNTTTVWEWFLKGSTPGPGNTFVSAWGWDTYTYSFNNQTEQMMLDSMLNILGNPADFNSYYLAPNANVPYTMAFRFDNLADKHALTNALSQNQNFFWIGHGAYNAILGNRLRADVGTADIENILENLAYKSTPKHPKEDKHQYRLVILNGCETYSTLWPGVFGIPFSSETSTNTVLDYQYAGQMPRAFVGWTETVKIPFNWDPSGIGHAQYGLALGQLSSKWMAGYPLDFCLDCFADMAIYYGYSGNDSWRISGCTDLTRW